MSIPLPPSTKPIYPICYRRDVFDQQDIISSLPLEMFYNVLKNLNTTDLHDLSKTSKGLRLHVNSYCRKKLLESLNSCSFFKLNYSFLDKVVPLELTTTSLLFKECMSEELFRKILESGFDLNRLSNVDFDNALEFCLCKVSNIRILKYFLNCKSYSLMPIETSLEELISLRFKRRKDFSYALCLAFIHKNYVAIRLLMKDQRYREISSNTLSEILDLNNGLRFDYLLLLMNHEKISEVSLDVLKKVFLGASFKDKWLLLIKNKELLISFIKRIIKIGGVGVVAILIRILFSSLDSIESIEAKAAIYTAVIGPLILLFPFWLGSIIDTLNGKI